MKKIFIYVFILFVLIILYSCASIKPVKPNLPTTRMAIPEPEKSRLNIPISININTLINKSVSITLSCYPKVYYTENKPLVKKMPLPGFSLKNDSMASFHISLEGELSYNEATKLANDQLKDKDFTISNHHIIIKDIQINGLGDKLIIQIKISGTLNGVVYFVAVPYYDTENQTIYIRYFDYSIETKNALIKMANWMMHDEFKNLVSSKLKFNISNQLKKDSEDLTQALNRKIDPYIQLSGSISSISTSGVFITDNSIKTVLVANGSINIRVK